MLKIGKELQEHITGELEYLDSYSSHLDDINKMLSGNAEAIEQEINNANLEIFVLRIGYIINFFRIQGKKMAIINSSGRYATETSKKGTDGDESRREKSLLFSSVDKYSHQMVLLNKQRVKIKSSLSDKQKARKKCLIELRAVRKLMREVRKFQSISDQGYDKLQYLLDISKIKGVFYKPEQNDAPTQLVLKPKKNK